MYNSFHTVENYKRILDLEERRGRLHEDSFSEETRRLSTRLKEARDKLKLVEKNRKQELQDIIDELKQAYEHCRQEDIRRLYQRIQEGNYHIELCTVDAKGKTGYATANVESMLVSKVLMQELKCYYKSTPANRNDIIEELRALLDNPMPKLVIRADIHHFFESIPQERLLGRILEDSYLPARSLKNLKTFLFQYNELSRNSITKVGIPRGLAFSSYLAEIYLSVFDRKVRQMEGVYFYRRYVDDIVLIANPMQRRKDELWHELEMLVKEASLQLNDKEDKRSCQLYTPGAAESQVMNYLGYQFHYSKGKLDVLLTEQKFNRYKDSVRLIFENYREIGSYTTRKRHSKPQCTDTTIQLMHRLSALTGNGHLNGRKNYVLAGIYYSNKYLTNLIQLWQLDDYIRECVNNQDLFCPRRTMFQYGEPSDYENSVRSIREKILAEYSFVKGFKTRRIYRWSDYTTILKQVGAMYYNQEDE